MRQRALDPAPLFATHGLTLEVLQSELRLPHSMQNALYTDACLLADDPYFGLRIGEASDLFDFGEYGVLLLTSNSGRALVERVASYIHLLHDAARVSLEEQEDRVRIAHWFEGVESCRANDDSVMAGFVCRVRSALGPAWSPIALELTYARPRDAEAYEQFFGCPVRFDRPQRSFTLPRALLDMALPFGHLGQVVASWASAQTRAPDKQSIASAVRSALLSHDPHEAWTADLIGKSLGISRRSLERWLSAEGTSFRGVVDDLRLQLAKTYLEDPSRDLKTIATQLGFSDSRAFARAFKRWTGSTPGAFRR
ncbi:MAG TPA: AraC family transcriptional regulator [Polyangiales bacterium]|nr:AraC family transcriptional regulator [Polyangiales bacterium]